LILREQEQEWSADYYLLLCPTANARLLLGAATKEMRCPQLEQNIENDSFHVSQYLP